MEYQYRALKKSRTGGRPRHSGLRRSAKLILAFLAVAGLNGTGRATTNTNTYATCFIPGEVSEYKVSWMKLPLAWSKTSVEEFEEEITGRKLIKIQMISKNYKAYNHIYKVDDKTEVVIDPDTGLPLTLDFILNEGGRHKSQFTTFDHKNSEAVFIDRISNTTNTVEIAEDSRDIVTFLYASRLTTLEELTKQEQQLFVEGKIYDLKIKRHKTKKTSVGDYGKVKCTRIEPVAEFDGLFLRQGKIYFWISETDHRMITCTEAKVPVGKVKVRLEKVSGSGDVFWDGEE